MVGHDHTVVLVAAFVKIEGTQIDPCAATHLLVDAETCLLPLMTDDILGIVHALLYRLVAHIDCISARLGDVGRIGYDAYLRLALRGFHLSGCTLDEGIFVVGVDAVMEAEPRLLRVLPLTAARAHLFIFGSQRRAVVVDDYLIGLPVALSGSKHVGARILEHWYEIGHHDGGSKQVFGRSKETGSLPAPPPLLLVVETAMAGIDREMTVAQTAADVKGTRHIAHPGIALIIDIAPRSDNRVGVCHITIHHQVDGNAIDGYTYLICIVR